MQNTLTSIRVRPALPTDQTSMITAIAASGLFLPGELDGIEEMLTSYFAGDPVADQYWITAADGKKSVGAAYYAPERMTDGTWNTYLIAVHADYQGQGHGTALMRYIERALASRGERVLLVETSGVPGFERTRAFYRKIGYDEEARIRDFYKAGDDKVIFRKALVANSLI